MAAAEGAFFLPTNIDFYFYRSGTGGGNIGAFRVSRECLVTRVDHTHTAAQTSQLDKILL
jgi:hypothetical protein